jgi:hypothetical protein
MTSVRVAIVSLISIRDFKKPQPIKQAEIEYRQRHYAVPPVEFDWKGEYEPQHARGKKQKEGHGNQIDAVSDDGLLAAKRRRKSHARHFRQNLVARQV